MEKRYLKNEQMLSREENLSLREKRVAVIGCGGLGGHILEQLARLGIGYITAMDGDVFDETNLNRQLLCHTRNIGRSKALEALEHLQRVNPGVQVQAIDCLLTPENALTVLAGHDAICDALDNMPSRMLLQQSAQSLGLPLVYGAIAGWYGQVTTLMPGDSMLESIFQGGNERGIETELGNPAFTPALVASIQVAEVVKILTGKGELLRKRMLMINTLDQEYEVFDF
ncbi:MAG: HesA/MoeB/ThiF family protein [Bacteroidales bacterium]